MKERKRDKIQTHSLKSREYTETETERRSEREQARKRDACR